MIKDQTQGLREGGMDDLTKRISFRLSFLASIISANIFLNLSSDADSILVLFAGVVLFVQKNEIFYLVYFSFICHW